MHSVPTTLLLLISILLASCRQASPPAERPLADRMVAVARAPGGPGQQPAPSPGTAWSEQRLIRSAELRIEVDEIPRALERADSVSNQLGALVADSRITQDDGGRQNAHVVIRVPSAAFTELLSQLRALGRVRTEEVRTEDVTKAYADLETRLAVKEETANRLRRLLADRTGRLSDVLDVERELSRVVTELEQLKGERRYYDQRVALSTVSMTLFEPGTGSRPGFTAPIAEAFGRSLQVLSTSVAWLVYVVTFLAPWLVLSGLGWWIVRQIHRSRGA